MDLSDLVIRLQGHVPARNGVPSSAQYEQAVLDAVRDFNRRASRVRVTTLAVVSGQADYTLPDDFVKFIDLSLPVTADSVLNTPAGLMALGPSWKEQHLINGSTLTIFPTPAYSATLWLRYGAGHVLDDSDAYPLMTDEVAAIALLRAVSAALTLQANAAAQEAWQYTIGEERISKEKMAAEFRAQAEANEGKYMAGVAAYVGHIAIAG